MEKVEKDCVKSIDDFGKNYDGCPYAHTLQEVPEDVKEVLSSQSVFALLIQMSLEEKKSRIREMILAKKPSVPGR